MNPVKIHLEYAESVAVEHYAEVLGVSAEDVAYAALHDLMSHAQEPHVQQAIVRTREQRRRSLPPWSDQRPASRAPFEEETSSLSRFL